MGYTATNRSELGVTACSVRTTPALFETLTKFNQISVVVEDVEIADPKPLKHCWLTSEAGSSIAQQVFRRVEVIDTKGEVNDALDLVLRAGLVPSERVFARSFDLDQFNSESLVFQNRHPKLYVR